MVDIVCILQNREFPPRYWSFNYSTWFSLRLWVIVFTCIPMMRVEHSFYLQRVRFHVLFFSLPIIVQVALIRFDLQKVRRISYTWVYTDLYFVASFSGYVQCYACMAMSATFSTESKSHHQSWSLCCCYLLSFYILQQSREATTWNQFHEYCASSLHHMYSHGWMLPPAVDRCIFI